MTKISEFGDNCRSPVLEAISDDADGNGALDDALPPALNSQP
eukprot:CAMPEP_0178757482 /NCGR_PEP_ID=MMETSP0744-20121128/13848_1 /TAXON_ID=913974 /ORGANISM="Nitzschia punctata, Strain CCMP561" /LENGTH=41 /DNA_ID= /DNA_START= /DNA_END= /DNA_ORIENTATION=